MARQLELFSTPLAVKTEIGLRRLWKNRWFWWGMLGLFWLWYLYWCYHIPSPSKAATVLGVVAAVMALRGEPDAIEKFFWVGILFLFLLLELRAIDHKEYLDKIAHDTEVAQQNEHFSNIGESIKTGVQGILNQSEKEFEATIAKEQISIDSVTGGHSFPMVFIDPDGRGMLLVRGDDPLYELTIVVKDNDGHSKTFRPPFPVNSGAVYPLGQVPSFAMKDSKYKLFSIHTFARNGVFDQLYARRVVGKGDLAVATVIFAGYIPLHRQVVVSQGHSKNYPLDKLDGDVMWDTFKKKRHIRVRGDQFDDMGNLKLPPP